ncbi:prepilin-type N-terminal cleavage/methylation domain-containing protein [Aquabacterium sp.]|uniref:prepilin-type N-terminal cleavage/methylation domain-containing protein n=1 Tax=Aquabacterium sp. TaxID=1872578 RepID=UPI0035C6691D
MSAMPRSPSFLAPSRVLPARRVSGFTLVEVLVALMILSVLAATAWKGLDAISSARAVADDNLRRTLRLQSVMVQWEADMAQVLDTQVVPGLEYDGGAMRFTRRDPAGVRVVAWVVRGGRWVRWASPAVTRVGELKQAWRTTYQLQGTEPGALTALSGVEQWQVYCFRNGSLTNCQSTGNVAPAAPSASGVPAAARQQLPEAVRLQLVFAEGSGLNGRLQRDVMLSPQPN